jgi:hypothetical protein
MKGMFNPTSDRHGHILTGLGGSPQVMAPFTFPTAEETAFLLPSGGNGSVLARNGRLDHARPKLGKNKLEIKELLVPVDSENTKPVDLCRVVQLARR